MKIQLFWFLTTTSLAFAGSNRRVTLPGIERRGEAYVNCISSFMEDAVSNAKSILPSAEPCIAEFEVQIHSCLVEYADQPRDDRTKDMGKCFEERVPVLGKCMESIQIPLDGQESALKIFSEARAHMFSEDPEIGCDGKP